MRSLLLVYVTLVVPIFFGPYYSYVRDDVKSFAFALFLVIVVRSRAQTPLKNKLKTKSNISPLPLRSSWSSWCVLRQSEGKAKR